MEGGALFNPGFLGSNFQWWVGQVADDSSWRKNHQQAKFKDKRHSWIELIVIKSGSLVFMIKMKKALRVINSHGTQVMYPITAGGGQVVHINLQQSDKETLSLVSF